ncbi:MAG: EamA family transporter [Patescibacteria group bacterium]
MVFHAWYFYIILFLIFHTIYTLLFRSISKSNPHHYGIIISTVFVFLWISGLIFSLVTGHVDFKNVLQVLPYLLIGGIIFAYANVYGSKAMGRIDVAQHTVLSVLRVVITVIASSFLLRESLNSIQILGAVLILSAVLISTFKITRRSFNIDQYSLIAILSAVLIGIAITNEKYILNYMNIQTYLIVGWGFQTFSLLLVTFKDLHNIRFFFRNFTWLERYCVCKFFNLFK